MAGGALFSGLVQGLGSSLSEGFKNKRDRDERSQDFMYQSMMYKLMNDPNLTGADAKEGFRQIGKLKKVNIPDEALNAMFPDHQVETDRIAHDDFNVHTQQHDQQMGEQTPNIAPMPTPPSGFQEQVPPAPQPQQAAPTQNTGRGANGRGYDTEHGRAWLGPRPDGASHLTRDPVAEPPAILGAMAPGSQTSSPVVDKYTSGPGSQFDDLDLNMQIQQLENRIANPPSSRLHRETQSSLSLSRAKMDEMRSHRLQQEQTERELYIGQLQDKMRLQQVHQEQMRELQLQPLMTKGKLDAVANALGHPLNESQKERLLGLGPQGPELERSLEAKDYQDMITKKGTPEGDAATARVRENELKNTHTLGEIQKDLEQIKALRDMSKDPTNNPKLVASAKVNATKQAGAMWAISDRTQYLEARTLYWEQQLRSGTSPEADPFGGFAKQKDPIMVRAQAIKLAQQDVQTYLQNLQDKVYQYGFAANGGPVITLKAVQREAEEAKGKNLDPNKIWEYYKKNGTILDDNLDVWAAPDAGADYNNPDIKSPIKKQSKGKGKYPLNLLTPPK